MENAIRITAFCSSSKSLGQEYYDLAYSVGAEISRLGHVLVYGGTAVGMMNSLAEGARSNGGKVIGIVNQEFVRRKIADSKADELILVETLSERKEKLMEAAQLFLILPGGLGTLDELYEVLSLRMLGLMNRQTVLLNWQGFYSPMIDQLNKMISEGFVDPSLWNSLIVVQNVQGFVEFVNQTNDVRK